MISVIIRGKKAAAISAAKRRGIKLTGCRVVSSDTPPALAGELRCKAPCGSANAVWKWFDDSHMATRHFSHGVENKRKARGHLRASVMALVHCK